MDEVTVRPVASKDWGAVQDLLGRRGSVNGCWCMFFRQTPQERRTAVLLSTHILDDVAQTCPKLIVMGVAASCRYGAAKRLTGEEPMLDVLGVTTVEERVYRAVVGTATAEPGRIARESGISEDEVATALLSLHTKGLVSKASAAGQSYWPNPPDVAFGRLLQRGQEALDLARGAVGQLAEEYRGSLRRRDAAHLVEVVTGRTAIRQQLMDLQQSARREIVWFCKAGHVAMTSSDNPAEFEALAKGVRYRVLYERALLEEPGMIENVADSIRRGEIARSAPSLPVRLAIADGTVGMCPLVSDGTGVGEPTLAVVRESCLLEALIALFERYWDMSFPVRINESDPAASPAESDDRHLLSLLVAGVADKAIATQLGVSLRTVQRRVRELMCRFNAQTRMQLAWEASRRGWLEDLHNSAGPLGLS